MRRLRQMMTQSHIDYYYVPAADPYQNEYVPAHWQRRSWISGFTGSAGDLIIGLDHAWLWTDSRYILQAQQEVDPEHYTVMESAQGASASIYEWLLQRPSGFTLGCDPYTLKIQQANRFSQIVALKKAQLIFTKANLIDAIWEDRPPLSIEKIRIFEMQYAGHNAKTKLAELRNRLKQKNSQALVINDLSSIAWLFNIRGNDIPYNPVVIAHAVITMEHAYLFIATEKLSPPLYDYCKDQTITIRSIDQFSAVLAKLVGCVWVDPGSCNYAIQSELNAAKQCTCLFETCPIPMLKAIKNSSEIAGMRQAHIVDAIALIRFLYWLTNHWKAGITELSASHYLNTLRREHPDCLDLSFTTISAFATHGAIVHYAVSPQTDCVIHDRSLYLIDSGGQYCGGTTDVTRTIHLGHPTDAEKRHYTLVLQGHLAIRHLIFPDGTCGEHIHAFAHAPLWKALLDYGHGTGHGVGCHSSVHEFPPRIAPSISGVPLKPGMIVSNEPGVYLNGQYGIRIENLCLVVTIGDKTNSATGHGPFYGFEDLTLVPYCRALIDIHLLSTAEVHAINAYHALTYAVLSQHILNQTIIPLAEQHGLLEWLKQATAPL